MPRAISWQNWSGSSPTSDHRLSPLFSATWSVSRFCSGSTSSTPPHVSARARRTNRQIRSTTSATSHPIRSPSASTSSWPMSTSSAARAGCPRSNRGSTGSSRRPACAGRCRIRTATLTPVLTLPYTPGMIVNAPWPILGELRSPEPRLNDRPDHDARAVGSSPPIPDHRRSGRTLASGSVSGGTVVSGRSTIGTMAAAGTDRSSRARRTPSPTPSRFAGSSAACCPSSLTAR